MSMKKIDPLTLDLVRGTSFERVEGEQEIRQGVDSRLQTLQGESPWDLTGVGTRWLGLILEKGVPVSLALNEITRRIRSQPGMLTVDEIDATQTGDRAIAVAWSGTASVETLNELLTISASTEVTA